MSTTLAQYTLQCQQAVHDANFQFAQQSDWTGWINRARNQLVADTGCNRVLYPISVNTSQEVYPFGGVSGVTVSAAGSGYTNPVVSIPAPPAGGTPATGTATLASGAISQIVTTGGSGYTANQAVTVTDPTGSGFVGTATVIPQTVTQILNFTIFWGNLRVVLERQPWTWLNAWGRAWNNQLSRPAAWAQFGQQSVYLAPIPDQTYAAEIDTVTLPAPLSNLTDVDVLQAQWNEPIMFYACYLYKLKEQSFKQAEDFLDMYKARALAAVRQYMFRNMRTPYDTG